MCWYKRGTAIYLTRKRPSLEPKCPFLLKQIKFITLVFALLEPQLINSNRFVGINLETDPIHLVLNDKKDNNFFKFIQFIIVCEFEVVRRFSATDKKLNRI